MASRSTSVTSSIVFENPTARIAVSRNVVVVVWFDAPRVATELREMERTGKKTSAQYASGTALFNVIVSGKPSFSQEVRDEVTRITSNDKLFSLASAHVLLVEGLVASAVRAFLSTALLLSRTSTPNKVFADVASAAKWVNEKITAGPEKWGEAELVQLVEQTITKA